MAKRLEQLQQMLLQEPNDEFLQYAIAVEYFAINDLQKAGEWLEKILSGNKNYLAAYYQLGKCYEAQNKIDKAKDIYEQGISIAHAQNKQKTLSELREALFLLED
ncbi:MAG: tetratricopeptide repeat protein [Bacteroidia bacterium]